MSKPKYDVDVLMIGNFAKDEIIVDGVSEVQSGGGVYFASVVVKRLGFGVKVITRLHPDDFFRLDEVRDVGVEVVAYEADGTSGIANYYKSEDMERRICKPIGFGGKYHIDDIPDVKTRVIMLSPLYAGEADLAFLKALASRAPVAIDIQGFVRVPVDDGLEFRPWDDMEEGLRHITYLKVDHAEAEYLTGYTDIKQACEKLVAMGPEEIVITQSSGVTAFCDGQFYEAPFTSRLLSGRTGRGDTCFSTFVSQRLTDDAETACRWAGVVTSMKQETPGPWKGTAEEVRAILAR